MKKQAEDEKNTSYLFFDNRKLKIYGALFLLTFFITALLIRPNQKVESHVSPAVVFFQPEIKVETSRDTLAWPKGTILPEDQAGYFFATGPLTTIVPKLNLAHASGEDLVGEFISSISIEVTTAENQEYWTYPLLKERRTPISFQQNEEDEWVFEGATDTIEMEKVNETIHNINEDLSFSGGEYKVLYTVDLHLTGKVEGQKIEKSESYHTVLPLTATYFTIPPSTEALASLPLFPLPPSDNFSSTGVWAWIGNYWLLIVLTVVFFGLYVNEWLRLNKPVEKSVKEYKQFKEWITEGSISLDNRTIINVYSLEGLVDLAIDLEKRVLHDPAKNKFTVFEDSFAYIYSPFEKQQSMSKKLTSLRDLLLGMGLIDHEELELGLNYRQTYGGRLGETLVSLGFLNETSLYSALAKQAGMNLFTIDPGGLPIQVKWLGEMTIKDCIRYEVAPVGKRGDKLIVACGVVEAIESREFLEEKFKSNIEFVLSVSDQIRRLLDRYDTEILRQKNTIDPTRQARSREEKLAHFKEQYQQQNFDLRDFIQLTGIVPPENMLLLPDKKAIIRYLIRRHYLDTETGHLLRALNTTILNLSTVEAYSLQIPTIGTILENGGYISKEDIDEVRAACGMDFERQKEYMLERFMISPYTMNATERLYSELNMIIQEIKFLS